MAQKSKNEIIDWIHEIPNYHKTRMEDAKLEILVDIRDNLKNLTTTLNSLNTTIYNKGYK